MKATVFYLLINKNISIQSKRFQNEKYYLCLGNIPGDFSANNMKKNRIK